jgi:hypothetical protein
MGAIYQGNGCSHIFNSIFSQLLNYKDRGIVKAKTHFKLVHKYEPDFIYIYIYHLVFYTLFVSLYI